MPEPYWPKHKHAYTLSMAERHGCMGKMRCRYCKTERHFLLSDLRKLLGDVECDDVVGRHAWRCVQCGKVHSLEMRTVILSAEDRQKVVIRRLERIDYIKRPVWRDERG